MKISKTGKITIEKKKIRCCQRNQRSLEMIKPVLWCVLLMYNVYKYYNKMVIIIKIYFRYISTCLHCRRPATADGGTSWFQLRYKHHCTVRFYLCTVTIRFYLCTVTFYSPFLFMYRYIVHPFLFMYRYIVHPVSIYVLLFIELNNSTMLRNKQYYVHI